MRLPPPGTLGPTFEEFFPERNALHKELDRLNEIVKSQRSSAQAWKHYKSAARTSNEYGGFNYYSRKERPREVFFNPWYKSSNEIGKYLGKPSKEDNKLLDEILNEKGEGGKKMDQSKEDMKETRSEDAGYTLPPLVNAPPLPVKPVRSEPDAFSQSWPKPVKSQEPPSMSLKTQHHVQSGPAVNNFMKNPMGKLWQNIHNLPENTGKDKRISPKATKHKKPLHEHVKLTSKDHALQFGIGKTFGVTNRK